MAITKPKSRPKASSSRTSSRSSSTKRAGAGPRRPGRWRWALLAIAAVLVAAGWFYRAPIQGYTATGSAYSAHIVCSCRYIDGRSLQDCKKDRLEGMELVSLSEDIDAHSISARYPLMPSVTATYRKGFGCLLEKWKA